MPVAQHHALEAIAQRMVGGAIEPRHREAAARWLAEARSGGGDAPPAADANSRS